MLKLTITPAIALILAMGGTASAQIAEPIAPVAHPTFAIAELGQKAAESFAAADAACTNRDGAATEEAEARRVLEALVAGEPATTTAEAAGANLAATAADHRTAEAECVNAVKTYNTDLVAYETLLAGLLPDTTGDEDRIATLESDVESLNGFDEEVATLGRKVADLEAKVAEMQVIFSNMQSECDEKPTISWCPIFDTIDQGTAGDATFNRLFNNN